MHAVPVVRLAATGLTALLTPCWCWSEVAHCLHANAGSNGRCLDPSSSLLKQGGVLYALLTTTLKTLRLPPPHPQWHPVHEFVMQGKLPPRFFTVGRLDVATYGLVFITNDGKTVRVELACIVRVLCVRTCGMNK